MMANATPMAGMFGEGGSAVDEILHDAAFSETIGAIYDCALDPGGWERALFSIRDLLNGLNAQLVLVDLQRKRPLLMKSVGIPPEWLERQNDHQTELADWERLPQALALPLDEPQVRSLHLPPELTAASRYAREWCEPQGIVDAIALVLMHDTARHAQVGVGRHKSAGLITPREIALARMLAPHVRRVVTISNMLDVRTFEVDIAHELFDAIQAGVVLVDERGRIHYANARAQEMLRAASPIRSAAGILQANDQSTTSELLHAIGLAALGDAPVGASGLAVKLARIDAPPAIASVLPIGASRTRPQLEPRVKAAVFIGALDDGRSRAATMAAAFALTPMETQVLSVLLAGCSLTEGAARLGIARSTAKTHMEKLFAKTGVSRQGDLIRLALSLSVPAV